MKRAPFYEEQLPLDFGSTSEERAITYLQDYAELIRSKAREAFSSTSDPFRTLYPQRAAEAIGELIGYVRRLEAERSGPR